MRRVRRKGGNKEKVFGCDLLEHLTTSSQEIPLVLRCCSEFVEKHGIVDGIYRLSGVSSNIQKLRGEFESDGSPDLNKDLYLQDIHCVSSLCKAYFRELPNPLLTYQLYDKFAEAVAIQLEEERLVKIRDVLKELPKPHYRTLEFLMRHLVRMASYSSETNMHARNLAIVWAPNLLRSKDIEASGFNGTAAFMEVRVQSIVVEFILTHVPQLFPEKGVSNERRNSLPSPTAACAQDEGFFKAAHPQPVPNFGNISPGDGPLPIRPYHAIIEGTDKRKGSLKGRKWMSIFNIGGRFPDPRRRHKHSAKEKERPVLRPARSMDSLSTPPYPNEGSRRSAQRPPSTHLSVASPLVTPSPQSSSDVAPSTGAIGGSEYAVTYRRGTGLVSGGAGTQGTYTVLDPDGSGVAGNECLMSRSPGLSTKVGRRAAMHITGPTMVTVPLHITSNLALGVLQGGGGDRVIHRGRDKDAGDRAECKEGGEKVEKKKSRGMERQAEEGRKEVEEEEKNHKEKATYREGVVEAEGDAAAGGGGKEEEEEEEEEGEGKKEEEKGEEEEVREEYRLKPEPVTGGQSESREQRAKSVTSNTEEGEGEDEEADEDNKDADDNDEYMEMKGMQPAALQPKVTEHSNDSAFDASDILNSTKVEEDDLRLSGYVQDNFDFLDQMDCSVHDHMDCSVSYQVNEFSVEPPGHSDDEYEVMEQALSARHPPEVKIHPQSSGPETHTMSLTELNPHRPLSIDMHSRHTKSLSLPYMTSPVHGPEESCSEEDAAEDDSDDDVYSSSEDDDSMFVKSLPPDFFLNSLSGFDLDTDTQHGCTLDGVQSSEEREVQSTNPELPACKESTAGDQDQLENNRKSKVTEEDRGAMGDTESDKEQPLTSESSTNHCTEFPMPSDDESQAVANVTVEREKGEVVDETHGDCPPGHAGSRADAPVEESRDSEHVGGDSDEGEDRKACNETEDRCKEVALEIKESDGNTWEATADKEHEEKMQEGVGEQESEICEIWGELEDVICEVIEDEESEKAEKKGGRGSVAVDGDMIKDGEEEEQIAKFSGEGVLEADGGGTDETEEKLTDSGTEKETNSPKTCDEESQGKLAVSDRAQLHDREEVVSKEKENNDRADERRRTPRRADKQPKEVREPKEDRKHEESDAGQGGVGRKLVISKNPKVYQVKAVPVVPPKPQHCKITALTLRQQQQQRERRDADRGRESTARDGDDGDDGDEAAAKRERPALWGGELERRRDGDDGAARDANRNSPLSMCFDEAVAIATMRREKEKECEKEKERHRDWGNEVQ